MGWHFAYFYNVSVSIINSGFYVEPVTPDRHALLALTQKRGL